MFFQHITYAKYLEKKVKKMILISSDKAIRPTNIMGASKSILSELIVKGFAHKNNNLEKEKFNTCFTMVRFGNKL